MDDLETIKKCNKILKQWICNDSDANKLVENNFKLLTKLQNRLHDLLANINVERENEILKEWINEKYEDCQQLRNKIEWEGLSYFYYNYTTVPVSFDKLREFYIDATCYCGNNCILRYSSDSSNPD